jgi:hypothetical protein
MESTMGVGMVLAQLAERCLSAGRIAADRHRGEEGDDRVIFGPADDHFRLPAKSSIRLNACAVMSTGFRGAQ